MLEWTGARIDDPIVRSRTSPLLEHATFFMMIWVGSPSEIVPQVNENHFEKFIKIHLHIQIEIRKDESDYQNDNNQNKVLEILTTWMSSASCPSATRSSKFLIDFSHANDSISKCGSGKRLEHSPYKGTDRIWYTWKKSLIGGSNGGISETFVAVEISIVQSKSPLS